MGINRMKPSLIYCKQFEASRPLVKTVVSVSEAKPTLCVIHPRESLPTSEAKPEVSEAKPEAPQKEQKKRGRKPNPKKEATKFVIEEKEVVLDFS